MVGITLEEVLNIPALKNARVLAGKSNMTNFVRGIAVAEVPDIVKLAKKDTIYLSTLFAFKDEISLQTLIQGLKDKGAAALFVKPKRFHGKVPEKAVEVAKELEFPLIEVDEELMWSDLIKLVLERILEEESKEKAERNLLQAIFENSIQKENEAIWRELLQLQQESFFRVGIFDLKARNGSVVVSPDYMEKTSREIRSALAQFFVKTLVLPLSSKFLLLTISKEPGFSNPEMIEQAILSRFPNSILILSKPFTELIQANERFKNILKLADLIKDNINSLRIIFEEEREEDLLLSSLLDSKAAQEVAEALLGKLQQKMSAGKARKILLTVYAFLNSDFNRYKTSKKLKVHVNTVKYRLNLFEEITGLNLSSSKDLLKLFVVLKLLDLKGYFAEG